MLTRSLKAYCLTTATSVCLFAASFGNTQNAGPFAKFVGNWIGNGELQLSNNTKEVIRCRGNFVAADAGNVSNLRLELKCANAGYRFELVGDLNNSGGVVSGTWSEMTRGLNGNVRGTMNGDRISAVAEGQTFTASLQLVGYGDKQHITISSPGSEISQVLIGLLRVGSKPPQQQPSQIQ
jgi:hypothetical protein